MDIAQIQRSLKGFRRVDRFVRGNLGSKGSRHERTRIKVALLAVEGLLQQDRCAIFQKEVRAVFKQ